MTFLQSLIYSIFLFSTPVDERQLMGTWSFTETKDQISHYEKLDTPRTIATRNNMHMYTFEKGGKLTVHQVFIGGFCGTPPHPFRANTGTWRKKGDQLCLEYNSYCSNENNHQICPMMEPSELQQVKLFYKITSLDHGLLQLEKVLPIR